MTLTAGDETATVTSITSSTVFSFSPAISVAAGGSVTFTLSATLAGGRASLPIAYAGFTVTPYLIKDATPPGTLPLGAGLMLVGLALTTVSLPQRRRLFVAALLAIGLTATLAGCGGNSSSSSSASVSIQKVTELSITNSGGAVGVIGLPAKLGTITKT